MDRLNDSVTVGVVLTLVFGALFFYLYTRIVQNEKRVSLIENILLDLKMSADAGYARGARPHVEEEEEETFHMVNHLEPEPLSVPQPLDATDVDAETSEDDLYKDVLDSSASASASASAPVPEVSNELNNKVLNSVSSSSSSVVPNFAAMTVKELKALAKQKGISTPSGAGRKELTDVLTKASRQPEGVFSSNEGASLESELTAE